MPMLTAKSIRRALFLPMFAALVVGVTGTIAFAQSQGSCTAGLLQVGVAEVEITPPIGFPMAGYSHEHLAEGQIDPLKAKAIVFEDGQSKAALVVCDLIGIATELSREFRRRTSEKTGIPWSNIVISA